jgi:hypothetical protein
MVMAISASVTVSMGELTMGTRSLMFLVTLLDRSTCKRGGGGHATAFRAGPRSGRAGSGGSVRLCDTV